MPARGSLYVLLTTDPELTELGFGVSYHANTVDAPREDKFLIIKHEAKTRVFGARGPESLTIWAHDKVNDHYESIDAALERVVELVEGATHLVGPDGWVLTQATWSSDGPDLRDEGYDSLTRWKEFSASSRYGTS